MIFGISRGPALVPTRRPSIAVHSIRLTHTRKCNTFRVRERDRFNTAHFVILLLFYLMSDAKELAEVKQQPKIRIDHSG